jgi:large subunit ribosomal protein L25
MEFAELKTQSRARTGKGGAKECRRNGLLPGIFYRKDNESIPLAVDPKQLDKVLNTHAGSNVIIKLSLEGAGKPVDVIVKELQVDNLKGTMRHVDFCHILLDRKIKSSVPFRIVGEAPGITQGGILEHINWSVEIESFPLDIPDNIEVDVSELNIGDSLSISQITVPEKVTVLTDADATIVHVVPPRVEVVEEPEEVEEEGVEPELVDAEGEKEAEKAEAEGKSGTDR